MTIRLLILLFLPFVCNGANYFRNDYSYDAASGHWFKVHPELLSWHDARRKCNFEGSELASPLNGDILSALLSSLSDNSLKTAYIGLHSTFSHSDWQSIDGIPMTRMKLKSIVDFSRESGRHCSVLYGRLIKNVNCSEEYPFICYKNATKVPKMNECGTIDKGYELDNRTGSCYKFHREGEIWSRGFEVCAAEGGYLAIIDNKIENDLLIEIFSRNPNPTIKSAYQDYASIGVRDWQENREWYTIHGEPFNTKEYTNWREGEPNNDGGMEYCVIVIRDGKLNDVPCNIRFAFICEKDPGSLVGDLDLGKNVNIVRNSNSNSNFSNELYR